MTTTEQALNSSQELESSAANQLQPLPDFNATAFKERYVTKREDGLYETRILLKGLRCAGCVHTSESLMKKIPGVHEAEVNYSNHRARLVWDPEENVLEPAIESLRDAGFDGVPQELIVRDEIDEKQEKDKYTRLVVAIFCSMNIMWIAIAQYAGYFSGMEQRFKDLFNLAGFILSTPVLFYSGIPFFQGAWSGLKNKSLTMDFQVAFSTSLIYLYSIYAALTRTGEAYFEAVAMFIMFLSVGKFLESLATRKISEMSRFFQNLIPFSATRIQTSEDGNEVRESVRLEDIEPGWIMEASPGERVVADSEVVSGTSTVDESHLTGESMPVLKKVGAELTSGSINQEGVLRYKVRRRVEESTLSSIIRLVDDALSRKPKTRVLADLLAKYFVSAVTLIALLTFAWIFQQQGSVEAALVHGVAVLIIACPCALSLATPIAVLTGLSAATGRKILFRSGAQFETLRSITDVVFDKTGTLTRGHPDVNESHWFGEVREAEALTLVSCSQHPISKAIRRLLEKTEAQLLSSEKILNTFQEIPGQGISIEIEGQTFIGGSLAFMEESGVRLTPSQEDKISEMRSECPALFFFAENQELTAVFSVHDPVRSESAKTVKYLQKLGLEVHLLTGDHPAVAEIVARKCGIPEQNVNAAVSPQGKENFIDALHQQNRQVIMAGDGINDAPALARADIGIAMGSSADKALEISDIVLLNNNPEAIVEALKISRKTFGLIRQNLGMSAIYNVIALPLAIAGMVIPLIAALSMSLSSLLVVLNSLRARMSLKMES